jgi:hypothetical protein
MTLTVETGAGLADSDSYAGVADADTYAGNYGLTWAGDDAAKEVALRRATAFLDANYRARFPGYRVRRRDQALEWPRYAAFVRTYDSNPWSLYQGSFESFNGDELDLATIPSDAVPIEIVRATIIAASVALNSSDLLSVATSTSVPASAGELKREAAGDHVMEYYQSRPGTVTTAVAANAGSTLGRAVEEVLHGILIAQSGLTARASRA